MALIFRPRANSIFKVSAVAVPLLAIGALFLVGAVNNSDLTTRANEPIDQTVPFSHKHHVSGLGLDCRYCHTTVENQRFAYVPGADTCMNCHAYVWKNADMLKPVRDSYFGGQALTWTRVNDLPDYVYFHHGIHISKGVGCVECHGHVENEALSFKKQKFTMEFCLNCHRDPAKHLRPREEVFNENWEPPPDEPDFGLNLVKEYHVESLTDCARCHR